MQISSFMKDLQYCFANSVHHSVDTVQIFPSSQSFQIHSGSPNEYQGNIKDWKKKNACSWSTENTLEDSLLYWNDEGQD